MKTIYDLTVDALEGKDIVAGDNDKPDTTTDQPTTGAAQEAPAESATEETPAGQVPEAKPSGGDTPSGNAGSLEGLDDLWGEAVAESSESPAELSPEELALKEAMESDEPPKEGKAWGALKAKLKEYEKKFETLESEPSKLMEQLEQERTKREEVESRFEQVSLVDSPKFKQEYDQKIQQALMQAARLLTQHAAKEPADAQKMIDAAIRMPFADRNRFLMDEVPELHGVLSTILLTADEKIQVRSEAIKDWKATRASLDETELRTSQVRSSQAINDALATVVPNLAAEGNPFYKKTQGSSPETISRNQAVDLRVNAVKQVLLKNDTAEIAQYVADGFVGRETREALLAYRDELKKVRAELKEVTAQRPGLKDGVAPVSGNPGDLQGSTVSELVQSAWNN